MRTEDKQVQTLGKRSTHMVIVVVVGFFKVPKRSKSVRAFQMCEQMQTFMHDKRVNNFVVFLLFSSLDFV